MNLLPSVRKAALPEKYEKAKLALAVCSRIDECKDWADRSAALASYAKQSGDKTMEHTAMRIRARAVRRCGELLKQMDPNAHRGKKGVRSDRHLSKRDKAATEVGLSKGQKINAIRVANVNGHSFEEQVESDNPPSVTALAEQGKQAPKGIPIYEKLGMTKQAFQAGMYFRGDMDHYIKSTEKHDACNVIAGSTPEERQAIKRNIKIIAQYHDKLESEL